MSKANKKGKQAKASSSSSSRGLIEIDPINIYFTHSRVRPFFTGCNKRIEDTLQEIVDKVTPISAIPLITVIQNGDDFFSLNNRRLYLFKTLRNMGLLEGNVIQAHIKPALEREKQRYIPSRCSLVAKMMKEHVKADGDEKDADQNNDEDDEDNEEDK